jgi:hypothetical protein
MRIVIVCLVISSCAFFACNYRPVVRSNEGALEPKHDSVEEAVPSDQSVDFEGVSFTYDPRVFGDVKKEVVPESKLDDPSFRPDDVAPEHVLFEFEYGREYNKARIAVYPLDKFDDVYAISPQMVESINKQLRNCESARGSFVPTQRTDPSSGVRRFIRRFLCEGPRFRFSER